jgi:hypothetical protein
MQRSISGGAIQCAPPNSLKLPVEFRANLPNPRISRAGYYAELVVVVEIASRIGELGVVKDVEELSADFESDGLPNGRPLRHAKISVVEPWTVEELAVGIAKPTSRAAGKGIRQKEASCSRAWNCGVEGGTRRIHLTRIHGHNLSYEIGHVGVPAADQGVIATLPDSNGEASCEASYAANGPTLR